MKSEIMEPKKIDRIPENAFWSGGVDGGNWYNVESVHSHKNMAKISVYNDQNGELIISKNFKLVCGKNQVFIKDLKAEISWFDGTEIHLKSGCWLQ